MYVCKSLQDATFDVHNWQLDKLNGLNTFFYLFLSRAVAGIEVFGFFVIWPMVGVGGRAIFKSQIYCAYYLS